MATQWTIEERIDGKVVVLHATVRGLNVDASASGRRLFTTIEEHVHRGETVILINLRDAHYMDSDGLGEIVRGYTVAHRSGGQMAVCELFPKVQELFAITRLSAHIPVFATEQEGLRALQTGAAGQPS